MLESFAVLLESITNIALLSTVVIVGIKIGNWNKDTDRLRAADMVLKVHGVFKELEDQSKQAPSVHIHIEGGTKTNVVTNLLVPIIQD
jgi:hypothetical protein